MTKNYGRNSSFNEFHKNKTLYAMNKLRLSMYLCTLRVRKNKVRPLVFASVCPFCTIYPQPQKEPQQKDLKKSFCYSSFNYVISLLLQKYFYNRHNLIRASRNIKHNHFFFIRIYHGAVALNSFTVIFIVCNFTAIMQKLRIFYSAA